jgi:hypothetical protein
LKGRGPHEIHPPHLFVRHRPRRARGAGGDAPRRRCPDHAQNDNKLSFILYPQAPRGVVLDGYILGSPAGGTVPPRFAEALRAQMRETPGDEPD